METNSKVNNFLQDLDLVEESKRKIIIALRQLVLEIAPTAKEEIKYGGLVYLIEARLFCGIFIRKNHISLEFDKGAEIQDMDSFLEGSGKYRRHLKFFKQEDIKNKKAAYYIKQCYKL